MAAKEAQVEPVNSYQLVGYTLLCWPQNHFYSANLIDILGEYNIKIYEAKRTLGQLRQQGYLEYCRKPPGLWRIRKAARQIKVPPGHRQIFDALKAATKENIDARLAALDGPPQETAPAPVPFEPTTQTKAINYYHVAAAALQIWPCNHFESTELAGYCGAFMPTTDIHYKSYRSRSSLAALVEDGRLWQSPVYSRLFRITERGRIGSLGPRGPEIIKNLKASPPDFGPPGKDYLMAWALGHPGQWMVTDAMAWLENKGVEMAKWQVMDFLKRLEKRHLVEQMAKGINRRQPSAVFRTRPAFYELAAPDLTLWEQLLHPEGGELAGRCYPDGRPETLAQVGKVAPELVDDVTVSASLVMAERGLEGERRPGAARVISLKGITIEASPAGVQAMAPGELSSIDIAAGLVDYINELRAGAGVSEVARLRKGIDNLNGALQKAQGRITSQETAIKKLNAIKGHLEEQVKELSSQLAAANNRYQEAKGRARPPVTTHRDKGSGFGLAEVATFRGRRLDSDRKPIISKKRAQR